MCFNTPERRHDYQSPDTELAVATFDCVIAQSLEDVSEGEDWVWED